MFEHLLWVAPCDRCGDPQRAYSVVGEVGHIGEQFRTQFIISYLVPAVYISRRQWDEHWY